MGMKLPKRELKKLLRSLEEAVRNSSVPLGNGIGNVDGINSGIGGNVQPLGGVSGSLPDLIREIIEAILDALRPSPPSPGPSDPVRALAELARSYQERGVPVTLLTTSGTVSGRIVEVGDDYVLLEEPSGSQVLVNLNNAYAIYPQGLE